MVVGRHQQVGACLVCRPAGGRAGWLADSALLIGTTTSESDWLASRIASHHLRSLYRSGAARLVSSRLVSSRRVSYRFGFEFGFGSDLAGVCLSEPLWTPLQPRRVGLLKQRPPPTTPPPYRNSVGGGGGVVDKQHHQHTGGRKRNPLCDYHTNK